MTKRRKSPARTSANNRLLWLGLGGAGLLALIIVIAAVVLISSRQPDPAALAAIPTAAALPTLTAPPKPTEAPTLPPTAIPPTVTDRPSATPYARATLPPSWTPRVTASPSPTPPASPTPAGQLPTSEDGYTIYPTLDPGNLANTYWSGDGQESMWDVQLPGNSYGRFDLFPINLYVQAYNGLQITSAHEAAIDNAVVEMNRVVPVVRVENRIFAHITVWLMTDEDFRSRAACGAYHDVVAACAIPNYTNTGILLSTVWMDATDPCFEETVLHELTHALGVTVHSPYESDIMYYMQTCGPGRYSERDVNTLRALYEAPAYNPSAQ
jgi:hypothetical protein